MGWDAFAVKDGKDVDVKWDFQGYKETHIVDDKLNIEFKNAATCVATEAGSVDWMLKYAALDISDCGRAMGDATGVSCWGDDWSVEDVKKYNKVANWELAYMSHGDCASESAKAFLGVCARNNLGIRFSW